MKKVSWLFLLVCLVVGLSINLLLDESHNSLDEKLIGYNVPKGDYVIFDTKEDSSGILGNVNLTSDENFLKGKAYDEKAMASRVFESNGRVRYMLPAGEYSISNSKGRIKDFSSKYPLQLIELKDEPTYPVKHSSTLVITEETPLGTRIRAVQPEPYQSIEDALKRPDVEEYFIPKQKE